MMDYQNLLNRALERGVSEAEIYVQRQRGLDLSLFEGEVDRHSVSDVTVLALRGVYQGSMGHISSEHLADDQADGLIDKLIDNARALTVRQPFTIFEGSAEYPVLKKDKDDFTVYPTREKIDLLKTLEAGILKRDPRVARVGGAKYCEIREEVRILNSKGLDLGKDDSYAYIYANGVFAEDGDTKSHMEIKLANRFGEFDVDALAALIVERGVRKLHGQPVATRRYPIVFHNETFAGLIHAFSSLFSGDAAVRNLTALKDKVGTRIAGENVTLVDDPLCGEAYFNHTFDDEGVACRTKEIVKEGRLTTLLHNLKTAAMFRVEPTGNGFKPGAAAAVGVSASNLHLKPGHEAPDDLIASAVDGLYITDLQGLHSGINVVSGNFSLQASGFTIQNGRIGDPVTLIVVSGNIFSLLNEIEAIGSDLTFTVQGTGSPTVRVGHLSISGT